MRYLLFLLQFLLAMVFMAALNERNSVTHTTQQWDWACRVFAVVTTGLYAWVFVAESRRERRERRGGKGDSPLAVVVWLVPLLLLNWITATSAAPLFMREESFEIVDVLDDSRHETHYTTKSGAPRTQVCDHYVAFRLADGRSDALCTDLMRIPMKVPGKGRLHVRRGLAGERFLDIGPYSPGGPG